MGGRFRRTGVAVRGPDLGGVRRAPGSASELPLGWLRPGGRIEVPIRVRELAPDA